jgi:hypothetical protein
MRYLALVLVGVFGCTTMLGQEARRVEEGAPDDVQKQIRDILGSKSPYESQSGVGMARGYRNLFGKVGADGIRRLQADAHDGIAIQAAWEEVALTVPEKEPERSVRPDRHKLDWFLGFLEGRGRVRAPQWWAEMVLDSRANRRDNISPGSPKETPYHRAGLDSAEAPRDTTLKRDGDKIILKVGKDSVPIPEAILDKTDSGRVHCNVSALITPSRCYITVHESAGYPYQLFCIDRSTAKIVWKSEVWATWWGATTGIGHMWVALMDQNQRIVVFGAGSTGIHVEAFQRDDGSNLFRFSSSY